MKRFEQIIGIHSLKPQKTKFSFVLIPIFLMLLFVSFDNQSVDSIVIHVALHGDDQNDGSGSSPVKTLEAARKLARAHAL